MSGTTEQDVKSQNQTAEYRVLARKYRPADFSDLIGQEPMVRTLTNAFETGRIAQAFMLTGVRGVGKTTTARILARGLNYKNAEIDHPTVDISELGDHCQAIMDGRHVDVIEMDAASHTGIDDIRDIIEQVRYRPVSARYKVYIIDEVHMLSTQAFNGLLKTLEEPPEHVKFIFATTEIRKVPITVLSRCQRFDLRRIDAMDLVGLFTRIAAQEGVAFEDEALAMIARAAEGSARDGLSLMDQAIAHGGSNVDADSVRNMLGLADRGRIVDLFADVAGGDVAAALAGLREQYDGGANPSVILTDLAEFTHLVTRLKFVPGAAKDPALSQTERQRGAEFADSLSVPVLSRIWQMLLKGISETESAARPINSAEMVLIRITHAASLPGPEELARQEAQNAHVQPNAPPTAPGGGVAAGTTSSHGQAMAEAVPGEGPTAHLRSISGNLQQAASPDPAPLMGAQPDTEPALTEAPTVPAASLADLISLADQNRDVTAKIHLRKYIRPVRVEPGRLEVALTEDAPKTVLGELSKKLESWTGRRWIVMLSRELGDDTLEQAENARREVLVQDARQDPDVAAILERFPGAKITDVRISTSEVEEDLPASVETDEGDIVPADTDS